ncbi:phage minor capsid protein [Huintestinicola butyrica]|uniref:phage minor capsid protein n=1 Tax=Huintestinicola butyrica TaxID=2981728 RepID=UPI003F819FCD
MLTPDYLQGAPAELEELFLKLEEDIIADICRRIAKAGYLTDSAEHQVLRLRELGAGTEYIKQKISEYSELSDETVDRLFFDAAQTSDEFYKKAYAQANVGYTPYEYNDFFQQAVTASVNQTKGELRNFTQSMGFSYRGSNGQVRFHDAAEAYRDCLDYAYMQVMTGAVDHNTAVRNATRRLTEGGLQFVDYASGVRCHADVAARRAVLTGLSQMTGKVSEHNAADLDTDIVEVDAHAGARPDHAQWQGKWYSLSGKSKKYPSLKAVTGYGTVTGLKGANCRHDFYPVIEGISEPSYTEEELKNIDPPPFEYNGKTYTYYEATQRQRAMERSMRKTKREILAADATDDKDRFAEKSVLLRRQKEEYGRFSKAAGLSVRNERAQVGGFGHSQASRAAWAERKASNAKEAERKSKLGNPNSVNFDVINSAEYRKKFDGISGDTATDNLICQKSRNILTHRNNSYCEDMYLIDTISQKVVGVQTHSKLPQEVVYNDSLKSALKKHPPNTLISIHNHPESKPPSGSDFYSCGIRKYKKGIICCHNGDVYVYQTGKKPFTAVLFDKTVDKYKRMPYNMNEKDAYITTLKQFEKDYGIKWEMR